MSLITLPDGTQKDFDVPVTVLQVAESIGSGLARAALAGKVNDKLVDVSYQITQDCHLKIITDKDKEGLEVIRHSAAHLLAQAVKRLYPTAQVTIGPVIEDGFYYDFAYERAFTSEDLAVIEAQMKELAKQGVDVQREEMERDEAIRFFRSKGEDYKAKIIEDIPADQTLSLYRQGDFIDLCRGPHVPNTNKLRAFKLMKVAGAYWRGNSENEMLTRIYGTAWPNEDSLKAYLHRLEEAEKRDHRKLATQLDLFHFQEEAPGMAFWHKNGYTIYKTIEDYLRQKLQKYNYQEIRTPQILDRSLWEKSGHWDKYREEMFITNSEKHHFAVKPMSCPCHVQVYNRTLRSYRDLPLRLAEFGNCHRNEHTGTLHGLMRLRNFTQDDAHLFCTESQLHQEISDLIDLVKEVYEEFGFTQISCKLSTRPERRVGSDQIWDKAESALAQTLNTKGLPWQEKPGDGAFYGPKIDFDLKDCLGRVWQCGTIQLDFSMPVRLGAEYIAEDGSRQPPVMIHRAILGSLERFIGIVIEETAGYFPPWLAPIQAVVMNITYNQADYAAQVVENMQSKGIRASTDLRNEKIGFKIREHTLARVPYLLVVGDQEVRENRVAVRQRDGTDLGTMSVEEFVNILSRAIANRSRVASQ